MSSNHSGRTTPHSDVDHPHRISYSPFQEEEDPQPVPILPPRPPTPGPIALENRGTQTSPKPCPVHQQYVAIMTIHTPPFARQIHQPHHEEHLCLLKSLGPYGRPKTPIKQESPSPPPLPVRIPYQRGFKTRKPVSPLTSPTTSSSSSGRITKNKGKGKKKHLTREQRKIERDIDRAFDDIEKEWDRRMEEFSQQQNEPLEYDDEALGNINEEPYGF